MSNNKKIVNFRFDAYDINSCTKLDCFAQLYHLESDPALISTDSDAVVISRSFVFRLYDDVDSLVKRTSNYFLYHYAIQLDDDSILEFLSTIIKFIHTPFICVSFDIYSKSTEVI